MVCGLSVWYGGGGAGGYLWYGVVWGKRRVGIHLLSESRRGGAGKDELCRGCFEGSGCQRVGGRCDWLGEFGAFGDCVGLLQSIAYDCNLYQILLF